MSDMKTLFLNTDHLTELIKTRLKLQGLEVWGLVLFLYEDSRNRKKIKLEFSGRCNNSFWLKMDSLIISHIDFETKEIQFQLYAGIEKYIKDLPSKIQLLKNQ